MDVTRLVQLEEAAWASQVARELYRTPLFPGFPWYTVPGPPSAPARRHVVPYHYTFRVFVKGRWAGRSLLDIYSEEHAHHSRAYYEACVQQGRLRRQPRVHCNVRRSCMKRSHGVDMTQTEAVESIENAGVLQQGDIVLHTIHRHEVPMCVGATGVDPILLAAVRITEYGVVVVHKPSGVPTHASGRYFMNSCASMLEYVLAPKRLHMWLLQRDPLLQSIVSTACLSESECLELLAYYGDVAEGEGAREECVATSRLPRPCHRLDKVTSGVLLFAVSHEAARRVGTVLAGKTKQMEEEILPRLLQLCENGAAGMGEVPIINDETLQEFNIRVRKRYLVRVHGRFPECALGRMRSRGSTIGDGSQTECDHNNNISSNNNNNISSSSDGRWAGGNGLFIAATPNYVAHKDDNTDARVASEVGPIIVLASPVPQLKFCDVDASNEPPKGADEKPLRELCYQEAATLCQPLHYYSSCSGEDEDESLVQCVPFSGRKHQIRMHVSHWGHPIVGDLSCNVEGGEQQQQQHGTSLPQDDVTQLYFSADHLPASYRKHFHTHDDLCWECAGRLPVASFGSRNRDAIALHAWRYEIDHDLLVAEEDHGNTDTAQRKQQKCLTREQEVQKAEELSPGLYCNWNEVHQRRTTFVRRQGPTVIFSAPPPPWSHH